MSLQFKRSSESVFQGLMEFEELEVIVDGVKYGLSLASTSKGKRLAVRMTDPGIKRTTLYVIPQCSNTILLDTI